MGYKVEEYRKKMGLTQEQLSEKSGVSRGTIHALENDADYCTTTKTLLKIADALGITVESLFFDKSV